jgi:hypothetical protein
MKTIKNIEYSFNHTKDRFKERYGIDISRNDYDHLCDIIRNSREGLPKIVEKQKHDTQEIIDLPFMFKNKNNIRIVWSVVKDYVTTALPHL